MLHQGEDTGARGLNAGAAHAAVYIRIMANRPCKPDADTKRLWQMLMPGTPMPACGVAGDKADGKGKDDAAKPDAKSSAAHSPRDAGARK